MTRVVWDLPHQKQYEYGVDRGVLYTGSRGVPWSGLVNISEGVDGGSLTSYYMDGIKMYEDAESEDATFTLEAFTYPDEFSAYDGLDYDAHGVGFTHQDRDRFSLTYRTMGGDEKDGPGSAYKIHLIYNAYASPSERSNATLTQDLEIATFSWDLTTIPEYIEGRKPTAHIVIDSRKADPAALEGFESIIYGSKNRDPRLPSPKEVSLLFDDNGVFEVEPNPSKGLLPIDLLGEESDIRGAVYKGLYKRASGSRLTQTSTGFYRLS